MSRDEAIDGAVGDLTPDALRRRHRRRLGGAAGGALVTALLRVGGHGRTTDSAWSVLEPAGAAALLLAVVAAAWAVVATVRADPVAGIEEAGQAPGRTRDRPQAVLIVLGWSLLGAVVALIALSWL